MFGLKIKSGPCSGLLAFLSNIALVYLVYMICRLAYLLENWAVLTEGFDSLSLWSATKGSLLFDTSAIVYTNLIFMLLVMLPAPWRDNSVYRKVSKWVFVVINSLAVLANLADAVYFAYTNKRTTCSVFSEFNNDGGQMGSIIGVEVLKHWYLILLAAALVYGLWKMYVQPEGKADISSSKNKIKYFGLSTLLLGAMVPLCVAGARGGFTTAVRPITMSNANQYVNRPCEAALVLNTPFSLIRTVTKKTFANPKFFASDEVEKIFSPYHQACDTVKFNGKNVVVLIMESFGREYVGFYNKDLDGGNYKGFTPFLDSLMEHSLTFDYTFANGRKSIDGMPSILSSIPSFVEPFFLTPYSLNHLSGLARELKGEGYYSAFFHGAQNGSMGFQAFAAATGYDDYFGRTEFNEDSRFDGDKDFDGTWAIWDEPFLQYYALKMNDFKQPFITSVFTASSHHPFRVPEKYKDVFVDEDDNLLHKCVRYSDNALRRFFDTAKESDWFKNTIFVISADHTNMPDHDVYRTDLGLYSATIFIYDPSGDIKAERRNCIAQQIDIMPTVLSALGYGKDYIGFGVDLLSTPDSLTWAVNYNQGLYQYIKGDYMIQLTENGTMKSVYRFRDDKLLKTNLLDQHLPAADTMQTELKAIIQSYMQRMLSDSLSAR